MKFNRPQYINRCIKNPATFKLNSGEIVTVYSINTLNDDELNEWAKHILAHYISQQGIIEGAKANKITPEKYVEDMVLPQVSTQKKDVSGNFGEIVFCDFIEFVLGYTVPRYKLFGNPPGNPTQGIDIVAYKKDSVHSFNDVVLYSEVKAVLSKSNFPKLQAAIDDISKRKDKDFSLALDTARRKLNSLGNKEEATEITRFQDSERPCKRIKAAGLITVAVSCINDAFLGINVKKGENIETHVIYANDLWNLAKDLWRRACL